MVDSVDALTNKFVYGYYHALFNKKDYLKDFYSKDKVIVSNDEKFGSEKINFGRSIHVLEYDSRMDSDDTIYIWVKLNIIYGNNTVYYLEQMFVLKRNDASWSIVQETRSVHPTFQPEKYDRLEEVNSRG